MKTHIQKLRTAALLTALYFILHNSYFIPSAHADPLPVTAVPVTGMTSSVGGLDFSVSGTNYVLVYTASNSIFLTASSAVSASQLTGTVTIPVTTGTGGGFGGAAFFETGTGPNNIVQLNGSSQLPAVDGSQLTGITTGVYVHTYLYVNGLPYFTMGACNIVAGQQYTASWSLNLNSGDQVQVYFVSSSSSVITGGFEGGSADGTVSFGSIDYPLTLGGGAGVIFSQNWPFGGADFLWDDTSGAWDGDSTFTAPASGVYWFNSLIEM